MENDKKKWKINKFFCGMVGGWTDKSATNTNKKKINVGIKYHL